MSFQRTELLNPLPKQGWNVVNVADADSEWPKLEWWADEIWILQSFWSPQDCRVYLTFLVDPQWPIQGRQKGEGVWAVKASLKRPRQWMWEEGEVYLTLGQGWQQMLPGFFEDVAALRNRKPEEDSALGEA
ncbi:MAG TPA: hypothetical protein VGW12_15305 [Pyrinomonadaceae bacterium]|nr:hypothetical protein [Pyrinomonadaceae bacterium]